MGFIVIKFAFFHGCQSSLRTNTTPQNDVETLKKRKQKKKKKKIGLKYPCHKWKTF